MPESGDDPFYLLDRLSDLREARSREARPQPSDTDLGGKSPENRQPVEKEPPDLLQEAEFHLICDNQQEAIRAIIAEQRAQRTPPTEMESWLPRVEGTTIILDGKYYSVRPYFAAWIQELLKAYPENRYVTAEELDLASPRGNVKRDFDKQVKKIPGLRAIIWAEPGHGGGRGFRRPNN